MGHVVKLIDGHLVYDGLLSSKEKATIDDILKNNPLIPSPYDINPGQQIIIRR